MMIILQKQNNFLRVGFVESGNILDNYYTYGLHAKENIKDGFNKMVNVLIGKFKGLICKMKATETNKINIFKCIRNESIIKTHERVHITLSCVLGI